MKMKSSITFLLLIGFTYWGCEEETDPAYPEELMGTWYQTSGDVELIITTDSAQTAVDLFAEGDGSIEISGNVVSSLLYLSIIDIFGINIISISNQIIGDESYPLYKLDLWKIGDGTTKANFLEIETIGDTIFYVSDNPIYNFNTDTYTLTIENIQLSHGDSTVIASGTLALHTAFIPANTPTNLPFDYSADVGQTTIVLDAGGAFFRTTIVNENITENTTGTWAVVNDGAMTIIETYYDECASFDTTLNECIGANVTDTVNITYSQNVDNGVLIISFEENNCADEPGYPEWKCLEDFENKYSIGKGTLVSIFRKRTITFSNSASKRLAKSRWIREE